MAKAVVEQIKMPLLPLKINSDRIGYDNPDTPENEGYIIGDNPFEYRIDFWNEPDATVPTQVAIIKDSLDPNLCDWDTLNFTEIGFLKWSEDIPGGQSIDTRIDMRPDEDLAVDVTATFDPVTGEIVWVFEAVDPITGDVNDVDPSAGFLPPFNEVTQYELGWVEFTIEAKDDLPTGTVIQNQAFVQFDLVNAFNPAPKEAPWTNTIDVDIPTSSVDNLPNNVNTEFTVSWTGNDVGSSVGSYDIYVSEDGQNYTLWLDDTTDTEATYTGEIGKTYEFFSVATDNVGNSETIPTSGDVSVTVTEDNNSFLTLEAGTAQIAYVAYYGRPADPGGVNFWNGVFERENINYSPQGGRDIDDLTGEELSVYNNIANDFGNSDEANRLFGNFNNSEKVNQVYNFAFEWIC